MSSVIIDFHTHIFPPWLKERRDEYVKSDPCFALLYAQPKARIATAEELIASMDEADIDLSVVLNAGWVSHELCVRQTITFWIQYHAIPKGSSAFALFSPGQEVLP